MEKEFIFHLKNGMQTMNMDKQAFVDIDLN
jgi:hypothetical protein